MKFNLVRDHDTVRSAIDDCLSGVDAMPSLRNTIMRKVRGEVKVKKKLSVAFVLIMVLVLLAVVAIAASVWQTFFEPVVVMETENGNLTAWTLNEKLQLLNLMEENGIDLSEAVMEQLLNVSISDNRKEQIATALIVNQYGREDAISHLDIMEDIKGPFETWSLEDKAWYSELLQ